MSDSSQGQQGVEANVTVHVRLLNRNEIVHTTPVTLAAESHSVVRRGTKVGHGVVRCIHKGINILRILFREDLQVIQKFTLIRNNLY